MNHKNNYFFSILFNFLSRFVNLKKRKKVFLLLTIDYLIIFISIYLVNFLLVLNSKFLINQLNFIQINIFILVCISTYNFSGQYNSLSRYIRSSEIYSIAKRNLLLIPIIFFSEYFIYTKISNYRVYILFWLINTFIVVFSRFTLKEATNFL